MAAKIQRLIALLYPSFYLPSAPAAPGAPTLALAGAGAGDVNDGAHTYAVTVLDVNSVESPVGTTAAITVVDKTTNGQVSLTAIPLGPTNSVSRKIYRSAAGTTTPLKLLTTIADNSTTTYTDSTADGSLGANVNSLVGISDPA